MVILGDLQYLHNLRFTILVSSCCLGDIPAALDCSPGDILLLALRLFCIIVDIVYKDIFTPDQSVVAHPGVYVGPSGSIAGCVEHKNCDPRYARRAMQDSISCTAWNIAKVALHGS